MGVSPAPADTRPARATSKPWLLALRVLPWLLVILLTALNLLYISRLGPNDDAYITYRVARNLAGGAGPVYNPSERVLSITTPGYAMLLAAVSPLSQDFVALALLLNGLALVAVGGLLIDLSRPGPTPAAPEEGPGLSNDAAWAMAATVAVTLALTFPLLGEALGMETPLYLGAILATWAAYVRALRAPSDKAQRWLLWTAVGAAAAFLLRPDGILVGVAVGLHWLVARRRVPWRPLFLGLALSLPWVVFAWLYYGSPIPNTLAAKVTQGLGHGVPRWGPELVAVARDWATGNPVAAVLAGLGLAAALWQRRADRLPLLLWAVLYVGANVLLDVRSYFWYYVPLIAPLALLAGDGTVLVAQWLNRWLGTPGGARRWAQVILVLIVLGLAMYPAATAAATLVRQPEPRRREAAYQRTGTSLRQRCAAGQDGPLVGLAEVGLIGYLSGCRIVDFAGLLQQDLAHLAAPPQDKITWAIQRYAPDLVVLSGGTGYPHQIADAAWFRQRYEPADIYDEGGFRSVIHQRGLGPSQQRDLRDAAWWRTAVGSTLAYSETLVFPADTAPEVTLHVYLPPGSGLAITGNNQPLAELPGEQDAWHDYPLALPPAAVEGPLTLRLSGFAGDQPAAVAWIDSNALPAIHYFVPLVDASQRPRPTVQLDPGQYVAVDLAAAGPGPPQLELLHRDRPGVQLAIYANGQEVGQTGGRDGWQTERLALPESVLAQGPAVEVQVRNQGQQFARLAYVALVAAEASE